jgi:hypothetical protein
VTFDEAEFERLVNKAHLDGVAPLKEGYAPFW